MHDNLTQSCLRQQHDQGRHLLGLRAGEVRWRDRRAGDADGSWPALRADQGQGGCPAERRRTRFVWLSDNDFRAVFGTDLTALDDDADYSNWLPNIDFSVALNDTMKVRASVSQTIARPQYNNLFMTTNGRWTVDADGAGRCPEGFAGVTPALAAARVDQPRSVIRVVLRRKQLRVGRLLQEGGQQLRRYRSHDQPICSVCRIRPPARLAL